MSAPSSANEADVIYKILLLGDTTVGKTCFLMRFTEGTFQEIHMSTIGLDYRLKIMPLDDGKKAKVQIWDTAGQDRFRAITKNYYKGAHGIILIFDVCNVETFENVRNWVTQIRENSSEKATIFLIGNKIDDEIRRKVSKDDGKKLAD
jgi:small GTP-binding protein